MHRQWVEECPLWATTKVKAIKEKGERKKRVKARFWLTFICLCDTLWSVLKFISLLNIRGNMRADITGTLNQKWIEQVMQDEWKHHLEHIRDRFPELKKAFEKGLVKLEFQVSFARGAGKPLLIFEDFDMERDSPTLLRDAVALYDNVNIQAKEEKEEEKDAKEPKEDDNCEFEIPLDENQIAQK